MINQPDQSWGKISSSDSVYNRINSVGKIKTNYDVEFLYGKVLGVERWTKMASFSVLDLATEFAIWRKEKYKFQSYRVLKDNKVIACYMSERDDIR